MNRINIFLYCTFRSLLDADSHGVVEKGLVFLDHRRLGIQSRHGADGAKRLRGESSSCRVLFQRLVLRRRDGIDEQCARETDERDASKQNSGQRSAEVEGNNEGEDELHGAVELVDYSQNMD